MEPIGGTTPRASDSSSTIASGEPAIPLSVASSPPRVIKPHVGRFAKPEQSPPSLFGLLPDELKTRIEERGHEAYRAQQILEWIYRKGVRNPAEMTNVSRILRETLSEIVDLELPRPAQIHSSQKKDAVKYALDLVDGTRVESVAMKSRRGVTLCLSSQAGCGMACTFCATGTLGLIRNLKAHEIVSQVTLMREHTGWEDPGYNLVFMGMGEPLANYIQLLKAIRILNHPDAFRIGARRITVSTVGLVPQMRRLASEGLQLGLALSLHATTDEQREKMVPLNKRYPLSQILEAASDYAERVGRRVTLEYVLLAGVNDSRADAMRLGAISRSLPCKINLIPYNPVPQLNWQRPSDAVIQRFVDVLMPRATAVTVRWSQGGDVWAACGQLGSRPPASTSR